MKLTFRLATLMTVGATFLSVQAQHPEYIHYGQEVLLQNMHLERRWLTGNRGKTSAPRGEGVATYDVRQDSERGTRRAFSELAKNRSTFLTFRLSTSLQAMRNTTAGFPIVPRKYLTQKLVNVSSLVIFSTCVQFKMGGNPVSLDQGQMAMIN